MRSGWWPEGVLDLPAGARERRFRHRGRRRPFRSPPRDRDRVYSYSFGTRRAGPMPSMSPSPRKTRRISRPCSAQGRRAALLRRPDSAARHRHTLRVSGRRAPIIHGATGGVGSLAIQLPIARRSRDRDCAGRGGCSSRANSEPTTRWTARTATSPWLHADFRARASMPFWRPSALSRAVIDTVRKGGRVAYPNGIDRRRRAPRNRNYLL